MAAHGAVDETGTDEIDPSEIDLLFFSSLRSFLYFLAFARSDAGAKYVVSSPLIRIVRRSPAIQHIPVCSPAHNVVHLSSQPVEAVNCKRLASDGVRPLPVRREAHIPHPAAMPVNRVRWPINFAL
eukprot:scaffold3_cov273-Pinguiococcus_pyrenoidosus.AAC.3